MIVHVLIYFHGSQTKLVKYMAAIKFEYFDLTKIRFFEIPDFSLIFSKISNSLIFPCREFFFTIFPIFPVFQSARPPCLNNEKYTRPPSGPL